MHRCEVPGPLIEHFLTIWQFGKLPVLDSKVHVLSPNYQNDGNEKTAKIKLSIHNRFQNILHILHSLGI